VLNVNGAPKAKREHAFECAVAFFKPDRVARCGPEELRILFTHSDWQWAVEANTPQVVELRFGLQHERPTVVAAQARADDACDGLREGEFERSAGAAAVVGSSVAHQQGLFALYDEI